MENETNLIDMKVEIMHRITSTMIKANEFKDLFNKHAYLWVDDRKEFMRQFLLYNHVLSQEEYESNIDNPIPGLLVYNFSLHGSIFEFLNLI